MKLGYIYDKLKTNLGKS